MVRSASAPGLTRPAAFTKMSQVLIEVATELIAASSVTSHTYPLALPPLALISATVASTKSPALSRTLQCTPFADNSNATAFPIPPPAPVTTAVRPDSPSH